MLKSLTIKNFRCFEEFELKQLGRVNLLVGKNNSGKTSVLEAVHILDSFTLVPFREAIDRRGEHFDDLRESRDIYAINHFYCGHDFSTDTEISIFGETSNGHNSFHLAAVESMSNDEKKAIFKHPEIESFINRLIFKWSSTGEDRRATYSTPLNISHELSSVEVSLQLTNHKNMFVSLASMQVIQAIELFNQIVITPQEETLYDALRFIEPKIKRIAPTTIQRSGRGNHGGFVVSIDGKRVPIGSMGDGIWRMLEITLAMVNIPGGTLLIDEIDTGLHFSVMIDLWRLICKTAEKLDIQVFATTHNSDCWKSLAEVANSDEITSDDITIHRIERGKKASIMFNEREMAIAADRDIEVR